MDANEYLDLWHAAAEDDAAAETTGSMGDYAALVVICFLIWLVFVVQRRAFRRGYHTALQHVNEETEYAVKRTGAEPRIATITQRLREEANE